MVGNPIKGTDCLVRKILNLWLEECGDKVNKAGSKAREMRRRGFRKGSIHFHIGLLKTQELEASCSSLFWGCLIVAARFCFSLFWTC